MFRHPLSAGVLARELSDRFTAETGQEDLTLDKMMRISARLLDRDKGQGFAEADSMAIMIATGLSADLKNALEDKGSVRLGTKAGKH